MQVSLWDVQGLRFKNCDFSNDITTINSNGFNKYEGIALYSITAQFALEANPTSTIYPLSENQYDRSSISGFSIGLAANNGNSFPIRVNRSDFNDNYYGLLALNMTASSFTHNTFNVPNNLNYTGTAVVTVGMYLSGQSLFTIEENDFNGLNSNSSTSAGIVLRQSGLLDQQVYRNQFNNLGYGTMVYGVNGTAENALLNSGLSIKCNDFGLESPSSDNGTDIYLHSDALIDALQGSPETVQSLAGNRFSDYPSNQVDGNFAIRNPNFSLQAYFHHVDELTNPFFSENEKVNTQFVENADFGLDRSIPCPSNFSTGFDHQEEKNRAFVVEKRADLEALKSQYKNILNGGIKSDIMELLVDDYASSSAVRQKLIQGSPYLSDDVLIAAINRQIPLNQWHLTEVLVWNSLLSRAVLQEFYQTQPLSNYLASLVLNKKGSSQHLLIKMAQKKLRAEILDLEKTTCLRPLTTPRLPILMPWLTACTKAKTVLTLGG